MKVGNYLCESHLSPSPFLRQCSFSSVLPSYPHKKGGPNKDAGPTPSTQDIKEGQIKT